MYFLSLSLPATLGVDIRRSLSDFIGGHQLGVLHCEQNFSGRPQNPIWTAKYHCRHAVCVLHPSVLISICAISVDGVLIGQATGHSKGDVEESAADIGLRNVAALVAERSGPASGKPNDDRPSGLTEPRIPAVSRSRFPRLPELPQLRYQTAGANHPSAPDGIRVDVSPARPDQQSTTRQEITSSPTADRQPNTIRSGALG